LKTMIESKKKIISFDRFSERFFGILHSNYIKDATKISSSSSGKAAARRQSSQSKTNARITPKVALGTKHLCICEACRHLQPFSWLFLWRSLSSINVRQEFLRSSADQLVQAFN
jgi:hypothetical protein